MGTIKSFMKITNALAEKMTDLGGVWLLIEVVS